MTLAHKLDPANTLHMALLSQSILWKAPHLRSTNNRDLMASQFNLTLDRPEGIYKAAFVVFPHQHYPEDLTQWFSEAEITGIETLNVQKRKQEFIDGRIAAKMATRILDPSQSHNKIKVEQDIFGRPFVQSKSLTRLSISHTEDVAMAIAFPEHHPMGLDIEKIKTCNSKTVESEMSEEEARLFSHSYLQRDQQCTLNWSIKESYSKALGVGLTTPFEVFEVQQIESPAPGYFTSLLKNFSQFQVHSWIVENYVFSMAVPYKTVVHWEQVK